MGRLGVWKVTLAATGPRSTAAGNGTPAGLTERASRASRPLVTHSATASPAGPIDADTSTSSAVTGTSSPWRRASTVGSPPPAGLLVRVRRFTGTLLPLEWLLEGWRARPPAGHRILSTYPGVQANTCRHDRHAAGILTARPPRWQA